MQPKTSSQCRLCLKKCTASVDIFKDDFAAMIYQLTKLKMSLEDPMPKVSCVPCAMGVKKALEIKRRILTSHNALLIQYGMGCKSKSDNIALNDKPVESKPAAIEEIILSEEPPTDFDLLCEKDNTITGGEMSDIIYDPLEYSKCESMEVELESGNAIEPKQDDAKHTSKYLEYRYQQRREFLKRIQDRIYFKRKKMHVEPINTDPNISIKFVRKNRKHPTKWRHEKSHNDETKNNEQYVSNEDGMLSNYSDNDLDVPTSSVKEELQESDSLDLQAIRKQEDMVIESVVRKIKNEQMDDIKHTIEQPELIMDCDDVKNEFWPASAITDTTEEPNCQRQQRKYNRHCCLYCFKEVYNFPRHLTRHHPEEKCVQKLLALHCAKRRKHILCILRDTGRYIKINNETSNLIQPKEQEQLITCRDCSNHFQPSVFELHTKNCILRVINEDIFDENCNFSELHMRNIRLKNPDLYDSLEVTRQLFCKMRFDQVSKVIMEDTLISLYAEHLFNCGGQTSGTRMIRTLRLTGKLLMSLKKRTGLDKLLDHLHLRYFLDIVTCSKELSEYNSETGVYKLKTVALCIGATMTKLCQVATNAITGNAFFKCDDPETKLKDIEAFSYILKNCWRLEMYLSPMKVSRKKFVKKRITGIDKKIDKKTDKKIDKKTNFKAAVENYMKGVVARKIPDEFTGQSLVASAANGVATTDSKQVHVAVEPGVDTTSEKNNESNIKKRIYKVKFQKTKFTEEQKALIREHFKEHVKAKKSPRKLEVLACMASNSSVFGSKTWQQVKAYVYNEYRSK